MTLHAATDLDELAARLRNADPDGRIQADVVPGLVLPAGCCDLCGYLECPRQARVCWDDRLGGTTTAYVGRSCLDGWGTGFLPAQIDGRGCAVVEIGGAA